MVAGVGVEVESVGGLLVSRGGGVCRGRTAGEHPVKVDSLIVELLVGVAGAVAVKVLFLVRVRHEVYLILLTVVKPAVTLSHLTLVLLYRGFGTGRPVSGGCGSRGGGRGDQLTLKLVICPHWRVRERPVILTLGSDVIFRNGEGWKLCTFIPDKVSGQVHDV